MAWIAKWLIVNDVNAKGVKHPWCLTVRNRARTWLIGMQRPDYNTINLFRKNRLVGYIDNIFTQVVQMLLDAIQPDRSLC